MANIRQVAAQATSALQRLSGQLVRTRYLKRLIGQQTIPTKEPRENTRLFQQAFDVALLQLNDLRPSKRDNQNPCDAINYAVLLDGVARRHETNSVPSLVSETEAVLSIDWHSTRLRKFDELSGLLDSAVHLPSSIGAYQPSFVSRGTSLALTSVLYEEAEGASEMIVSRAQMLSKRTMMLHDGYSRTRQMVAQFGASVIGNSDVRLLAASLNELGALREQFCNELLPGFQLLHADDRHDQTDFVEAIEIERIRHRLKNVGTREFYRCMEQVVRIVHNLPIWNKERLGEPVFLTTEGAAVPLFELRMPFGSPCACHRLGEELNKYELTNDPVDTQKQRREVLARGRSIIGYPGAHSLAALYEVTIKAPDTVVVRWCHRFGAGPALLLEAFHFLETASSALTEDDLLSLVFYGSRRPLGMRINREVLAEILRDCNLDGGDDGWSSFSLSIMGAVLTADSEPITGERQITLQLSQPWPLEPTEVLAMYCALGSRSDLGELGGAVFEEIVTQAIEMINIKSRRTGDQ